MDHTKFQSKKTLNVSSNCSKSSVGQSELLNNSKFNSSIPYSTELLNYSNKGKIPFSDEEIKEAGYTRKELEELK